MAGFNTAVSGIRASSSALDVTGNNIANASTTGFKSSRTEFADIYATAAIGSGASNTAGSGVLVADIAQDFSGGNVQFTNNNLDLSIDGSGFFQLDDGRGNVAYTRDGSFELDKDGNIIAKSGTKLQGFGVDTEGNRLPIGDLKVAVKESPPKATENMSVSFNIDESKDAAALITPYSREEAGSATFSTTVGTFDSLGNEHTIRYDMVEQQAKKEIHTYDIGTTQGAVAGDFSVSGIDIATTGAVGAGDINADGRVTNAKLLELQAADPRIFDVIYTTGIAATTTPSIQVILEAAARESGAVIVGAHSLPPLAAALLLDPVVTTIASNESHIYQIPAGQGGEAAPAGPTADETAIAAAPAGSYVTPQQFSIVGINFSFNATPQLPITREEIAAEIISKETQIRDANPNIESIAFNNTANELQFTFKAESGNVGDTSLAVNQADGNFFGGTAAVGAVAGPTAASNDFGLRSPDVIAAGDDSFEGVYRLYAYLNPLGQRPEALDIGKTVEPGSQSAATTTEIGAVIIRFNPTNGILTSVNENAVPTAAGAVIPKLTIKNADPANAATLVTLDLAGTTQFANEQIVRASSQDGYTKGDLTGVAFTPNGEMIASFSNNQNTTLGIVAIATFENQAGMTPGGSTQWLATNSSGQPVLNPPGSGLNGTLRSSALESSNVDLSAELVKLIEFQRNFQANSKTLETLNTVTQNILQI